MTATPTVGGAVTPTVGPEGVVIELWEDGHQSPVLATFGDPGLLDPGDDEWDEFLWEPRGYPGVFADPRERGLPVMRFHAEVPGGTYRLVANLYHRSDYRYYYGFSADRPRAHAFDVTTGPWGDFQEFDLGEVAVSGGLFELYTDGADLIGGEPYYFGWSWLRLIPVSAPGPSPTPTEGAVVTPDATATPTGSATATPTWSPTPTRTVTASPTPTLTVTPTPTPTVTAGPALTATPTVGGAVTPTVGPEGVVIELWEDGHQSPVLATFGDPGLLDPGDDEWDEFLWEPRGYPGVFADPRERGLPVMRFHAEVPGGTYRLVANLYHRSDYRYYYGFSADRPRAHAFDVTTGPWGDFQEFDLGEVAVSGGLFELYTDGADLIGGEPYYFGWSWLRLIPVSAPTVSSGKMAPAATGTGTAAPSPTAAAAGSPSSTAGATDREKLSSRRTPTPTPIGTVGGETATPTWTATATGTPPGPPSGVVAVPPRPGRGIPTGTPATPGPDRASARQ